MERIGFSEGIYTNTQEVDTPAEHYIDAQNMRVSGRARRTEEGNQIIAGVPTNIVVWGSCDIGEETIVLGTTSSKSIIGSLDKDDNWTVEVPVRAGVDILGIVDPTQVEGKKNWAGERVIYFSTPSGARRINLDIALPSDDTEFDKVTSLFLEYDLPEIAYTGEDSTGQVPTGVYQFQVRLKTDSGATTPFGVPTGIIPVVSQSLSSSRHNVDGDPPQSNSTKAINLTITNIDTSFKYIEIGILTYEGLGNTVATYVTNEISINSQTTIEYTYRGPSNHADTIENAELITSGVQYSTGKFFAQKDDSLIIGAPTEAEQPDIDWFRVAENITTNYVIKRIPFLEALQFEGTSQTNAADNAQGVCEETSQPVMDSGYNNPITCALYKGYRRNEVYSFMMTPIFTNGVKGPTVHIPANHAINTAATVDGVSMNNGGVTGTYISEETYPDDRYTGLQGTGLRLHKMPTAKQQPLIEGNVENNNCYIRVIGIEFTNIALDASEVQFADRIAGIIFTRVDRRGEETQLGQCIVRPHHDLHYNDDPQWGLTTTMGDGYGKWRWHPRQGGSNDNLIPGTNMYFNDFNILCPDIIHGTYSPGEATHISQHSVYTADPYAAKTLRFNVNTVAGRSSFGRARMFFKNILGDNSTVRATLNETKTQLSGQYVDVPPFGVPLAPYSKGGKRNTIILLNNKKIELASTMGFLWMETLNGTDIQYYRDRDWYYESLTTTKASDDDDDMEYLEGVDSGFRAAFVTHTLSRENTRQYGALDQQISMFVDYIPWTDINQAGTAEVYNGDTFITKYALQMQDEQLWPRPDALSDDADTPDKIGFLKPAHMSGIVYFWLESDNNYNYRHYFPPTTFSEDNVTDQSTFPFFPAYKQIANNEIPFGLLSAHAENWVHPGHPREYNTQYSTQPTNTPYAITPPEDITRRDSLQNRIIYSAQAVQGEKTDAYQIFLPNDYYDVPQQFGELTDVYLHNELYASTPYVQWKLFFNTLATQTTSAGQIVLGTGGAFNRPAVPLTTVDGGYGGNTHWLHAVNTVYGRVFVDKYQGKIFNFTDTLAPISGDIDDEYKEVIQALADDDIRLGSEPLRDRTIIKLGTDVWSWHVEKKKFISKHTYQPRWFFTHGPYLYSNQIDKTRGQTGIFKHGIGNNCEFYGLVKPSYITLVANMGNDMSKLFRNLELVTRKTTEAGLNIPLETFDFIEVWNDERYSGKVTITADESPFALPGVLEILTRKVKDGFRMVVPRDIVVDPSIDIFINANHAETVLSPAPVEWLPKMRGMYIAIRLTTNNTNGILWLQSAKVGIGENIR